ncbi:hypothetical protein D3C80_2207660 [compost metagenome]
MAGGKDDALTRDRGIDGVGCLIEADAPECRHLDLTRHPELPLDEFRPEIVRVLQKCISG